MAKIDQISSEVIAYLEDKLDPHLYYHDAAHTTMVLEFATRISIKERISKKDMFLVQVAAVLHDIGFVKQQKEHEAIGCKMAAKWLKKYGINAADSKVIRGIIMATRIPQSPKNLLESILADADLMYLGTNRFDVLSKKLYKELKHFNPAFTPKKWHAIQISFISAHHYHTSYCQRYYEFRKQKKLQSLIAQG